jgi:hypothetical protein
VKSPLVQKVVLRKTLSKHSLKTSHQAGTLFPSFQQKCTSKFENTKTHKKLKPLKPMRMAVIPLRDTQRAWFWNTTLKTHKRDGLFYNIL